MHTACERALNVLIEVLVTGSGKRAVEAAVDALSMLEGLEVFPKVKSHIKLNARALTPVLTLAINIAEQQPAMHDQLPIEDLLMILKSGNPQNRTLAARALAFCSKPSEVVLAGLEESIKTETRKSPVSPAAILSLGALLAQWTAN